VLDHFDTKREGVDSPFCLAKFPEATFDAVKSWYGKRLTLNNSVESLKMLAK